MADTNILLQKAYEVRDEVSQGGNTASRVGTLFADIIENFELYAKKSDVISMIPEVDLSGYLSKKDAANTYLSKIDAAQLYTSLAAFSDLFSKVVIKEAVAEETDGDGNVVTPAQPAVYAIKAKYDLFSVGGLSAYGFSGTGSGGGTASVDVTQILKEGTPIATINGVTLYAPEGGGASVDVTPIETSGTLIATINGVNIFAPKGGASSWNELTGNPPNVSIFTNNAGYITDTVLSAVLSDYTTKTEFNQALNNVANNYVSLNTFNSYKSDVSTAIGDSAQGVKNWVTGQGYATEDYVNGQKITGYGKSLGINGKYLRLLDESGSVLFPAVIAPYAAYTDQLGATDSNADVSIYGEVKMKNGSLAVAGNVNANFNLSAGGNLSAGESLTVTGESRFSGAVYLPGQLTFFGQNGIYVQADRTTQTYGTAAYIGVHENHVGSETIATVNLDGRVRMWQPMGIRQDPEDDISLRVGGTLKTDFLTAGGTTLPNGFWLASPNGYFGNPSTRRYTQFGEGGDIELSHPTPFIDFHYGCSTADFTSRLIAAEDGVLMIQSATTDPALRIGNAYLRYDLANNALYVTGVDGAQVNFYATGNVAGYSGLDGSVSELTNLDITGQLTAASVKANYVGSDGILHLNAGSDSSIILNKNMTVDSDGWITTPQLNATQRILVNSGGDIRIGSTAANHGITDVYADGTYVYITINGKRYRFTPSSTTTV